MKKNQKGFTLIELLVVIAIIGLLSTLSVVALNQARARARDARRVADIKQIQTALEMYYNDQNSYPATLGTTIGTGTVTYMTIVPTAPTPFDGACTSANNTYVYLASAGSGGTGIAYGTYTLKYCLGVLTGGAGPGAETATPSGIH